MINPRSVHTDSWASPVPRYEYRHLLFGIAEMTTSHQDSSDDDDLSERLVSNVLSDFGSDGWRVINVVLLPTSYEFSVLLERLAARA